MKNMLKIYDIFKSRKNLKETESLNDISKTTKKMITDRAKYHNYFLEYTKKTEVNTFKSPGITHYPLLQKKSCSLLPIHRKKMDYYEDFIENKKEQGKISDFSILMKNSKFKIGSNGDSFYKNKMKQNIKISKILFKNRLLNIEKQRLKTNSDQRYNSLFLDFFHKWNKDKNEQYIYNNLFNEDSKCSYNYNAHNIFSNDFSKMNINNNDYKHIINEKYSELKYDDNLIFNSDYTQFVDERLDFIALNNIENVETKLENIFNDFNKNEIKLRLESIKINFKQIRSKISALSNFSSNNKNLKKTITLYIPLYFAFIFCIKDVDFFKYILLSCITFSENEKIIFDESKIRPALKALFTKKREEANNPSKKPQRSSGVISSINKKNTTNFRKAASKVNINFRKAPIEKKGTTIGINNKIFNMARNSILENFSMNFKKNKKEKIIHSNKKYNNYFHDSNYFDNKNEGEINKINNRKEINQYNEYVFIWETSDKTYEVNLLLPIIFFNYKNLKEEIALFCDKSLFLYMYKNNFINWDFYSLNYLFSIKLFRKKILQNYSLAKRNVILPKNNLEQNLYTNNYFKHSYKKNETLNTNASFNNYKSKIDNNEEISILNEDKNKTFNMINNNNESYIFFYTDESYHNTLIKVYSYLINIDYEKLNPKIRWKYILNFKHMKLLNEITKYEPLETFLPKIIQTDFQNGHLSIDFSLFKEFNINILGYEKKDLNTNNSNISKDGNNSRNKMAGVVSSYTKENDDLCIDIKFPSLKQEKFVKENEDKFIFKKVNTDLDINFLQDLNKYKMEFWSKKILDEIHRNENYFLYSNKNITPILSDKKNYIKKTNTHNNKVSNFSTWNENSNKVDKKFLKSTTFNYSKLGK